MTFFKRNILTTLFILSIISTQFFAQKFNFRNFSLKEGISDAIVLSIAQTDDGFIYFGTQNGLSRFDGINFNNFSLHDGLANNTVRTLLSSNNNKLFIGTFGGLSIFDGSIFTNFSQTDGLANDTIYTISEDNNNYLIGTRKGISIFDGGKFLNNSKFNFFDDKRVYAIQYDLNNNLYVGTNSGLFKIEDDSISLIHKSKVIYNLELSSNGILWLATEEGAFSYKNNTITKIQEFQGFPVYSIKEDNKEQIWFGTDDGITKKEKDNYSFYNTSNNLVGKSCFSIFLDKVNNIWFATDRGVALFDDGKFLLYGSRFGVPSLPWTVLELSNGEIWVATDGNGVVRLDGDNFVPIPYLKNLPPTVWSLFQDKDGNIWFATSEGASKLDKNNKLTQYNSKNGLFDDMILSIDEDQEGNIWFSGFRSGVYKLEDGKFINFELKNTKNSSVYGSIKGFDNDIWFYSSLGLDRIKKMKNINFSNQDVLNKYSFYSGIADRENNLLILGTYERGLIIYNPNLSDSTSIVKIISTADGLNDNAILFEKFDDSNSILWIGTNKGLNKFYYQKFINTGIIIIKSYNEYDGIPGYECNQLGAMIDSKGNLWFSTVKGVVKYNKTKEFESDYCSTPYISSIEINYKNINLAEFGKKNHESILGYNNIEFPYFMNNVTLYFSGLNFINPFDVKFKYRLLGSNDEFSSLTKNNYVTFSSLPPGNYTFELISYTDESGKYSHPIQFSFLIETPIWRSNFFFVFIFLIFILGIYGIFRIRTTAIRKKNNELLKLYKENISFQQQLIKSEKDYKGLFENAHSAILIIDPITFLIVDANYSAELLYGYNRDELLDLSTKVLSVDVKNTEELIKKVIKDKGVKRFRTAHLKKDGSEIILNINASITNYKGKTSIVSLHRDITEEVETKKQLLIAKETAEKSNRLKSEFLAQISHEIRTPINTILGYVSLIRELISESDDDEINSLFPPLKRSSERIIRTIDLVLNMSEVNAGTFDLDIKELEVSTTLEEIVVEQRQNAKRKNLRLNFKSEIESFLLSVDEYTFTQIFVNLIDNAIKYTHEGDINVVISKKDFSIIIEIIDTGIGISEEYIPFLFDSFSQEEQGYTRKYEGNGLGLALVKNYVEINDGEISVESKKGEGTTFKVEFQI